MKVGRKMVTKVGSKTIGDNEPTYLIAEIGINHNGILENAYRLIENAKVAGFDAVKFQKRTIDVVYTKDELEQPRENFYGKTNGDLKRGLEFSKEDYLEIDKFCHGLGIDWFASPWDEASVDFLENFGVVAHKIASASLTDKSLLEKIRDTNKPVFLSTGMSTINQIKKAVEILGAKNLILLHAVSSYPVKDSDLNLSAINTLRHQFTDIPIGYSGHEVGVLPSVIAVAKFGAVCVERHITLDRAMWGSDQSASLELPGMVKMVRDIREIPKLTGTGEKVVQEIEVGPMNKLRRVNTI
jgi:N-acetylneuraminate synthase